jgi:hypothetical protein
MRDLASNIGAVQALAPAVQSATIKGSAIDLLGFDSVAFVVNTGAVVSSGNFTVTVEESDTTTDGDFTTVADADLTGDNLADPLVASSCYRVGYVGTKRYARIVLTKNSGTSIAAGAVAVKGHPRSAPVA